MTSPATFASYQRGGCSISTDPARLDFDLIHRFLCKVSYWAAGITRETLVRALSHSLCFGLYAGASQIGFARVITDYTTYAHLDDVFILEPDHGQGLGSWLIECVLTHPDLQTIRRFSLTTRDAQAFYSRFGWRPLRHPERHMERLAPGFYPPST